MEDEPSIWSSASLTGQECGKIMLMQLVAYVLQGDTFACLLGEKSSQNLTRSNLITVTFLLVPIYIHALYLQ